MSDHGNESDEEQITDLSNPDVTTKYQTCALIVNKAVQKVLEACVDDADVHELCKMSDDFMIEETGKLYNKKVKDKKIEKGIAFPTCISVNELVGHFSPLQGESRKLKSGDLVKVDLGCHIDGYIAQAAHTIVIGEEKVEDRRADVIHAAWNAAEAALRLVQVGNKNTQVTEVCEKIASGFNCKPVMGIKSHQLKRFVIDGARCIANIDNVEDKVEPFEFEQNEVYCMDIVMSTGEGKAREAELRSTVFKRNVEVNYLLKTQKARQFISEVGKRFPALPFSITAFDESVARIGVSEAKRHELLEEYPVLTEKPKEFVAQFKFTVLLLPGGTKKITGFPLGEAEKQLVTACGVTDPEIVALLKSSANPKKAKKKNKDKDGEQKDEKADKK
eukprot:TRINITY_DN1736_c0_g2_i1.p2 TRINITY_DN1736_c0_g2~~TRINITY_DN1736_c0_g2_i1.p2  ORF type:complete len:389 (+),score=172.16 TRINITY_DN1736_c0_g2_i1:105-1271(+)